MITENGVTPAQGAQYKLLFDDQLEAQNDAATEVLGEVGIRVMHNDALDLMKGSGCDVDYCTQAVKIPEDILMKYLGMAPGAIRLCGRDSRYGTMSE